MRFSTLALCAAFLPAFAAAQVVPSVPDADRLAAYEAARLSIAGFVERGDDDARRYNRASFNWQPYRGDERIGEEAFYGFVGRDDLAAQAHARRSTATGLTVAGVLAVAAGTAAALLGAFGEQREIREPDGVGGFYTRTEPVYNYPLIIGGSVAAAGGLVAVQVAFPLSRRRATNAQEAHDMTERYNAEVARMLSAPPPPPATTDG